MLGGWGWGAKEEELVSPQTNRVISTFRGSPSKGVALWSLISVRVSEAMKCGGKPKPWGRAQMVERSQDCKQSSTLKGVRWLFHLR